MTLCKKIINYIKRMRNISLQFHSFEDVQEKNILVIQLLTFIIKLLVILNARILN